MATIAVKEGNPLGSSSDWDLVLWVEESNLEMERGLPRLFKDRFPELKELDEKEVIAELNQSVCITVGGERKEKKRSIYRIMDDKTLGSKWERLSELKDMLGTREGKRVAIPLPDGERRDHFLRLVSAVFVNDGTEVSVCVPARPSKKHTGEPGRGARKRENGREKAIMVKPSEGTSYSEMLKTVREELRGQEDDIKQARKIQGGGLVLQLSKKGAENKDQILERIKSAVQGAAETRLVGPIEAIVIRRVDEATSEEEILEAVKMQTKNCTPKLLWTSQNRDGRRTAKIEVTKEAAIKIARQGKIRIGWSSYPVHRFVATRRCYRCLKLGHIAANCEEQDRKCLNCLESGHEAVNCKNAARCADCKEEHKTETAACLFFKRKMEEASRGNGTSFLRA